MAQLIPYAAAAVTFVATGGNVTATQFAFVGASALVGIFGPKPEGPGPGDLAAPQVDIGALMPRIYGRVRLPLTPIWISDFRATEIEQGGKGPPEGPSSYTYSADILGILADGNNALAWTRIFRNQKLQATRLSSSDDESVEASEETDAWEEVELFTGSASQQPWSVYEDAVGAGTVPAYRDVCTFAITDAQCGSTKQLPVFEVEVVTAATEGVVNNPPLEELFSFDYSATGSVQFGNSTFSEPYTILGETSPSSNQINIHRFQAPSNFPFTELYGVSGIAGGGVTPFGGTGDTLGLVFRVGGNFYGTFGSGGIVEYAPSVGNTASSNVGCYVFEGSTIWIASDAGELFRFTRATGGTQLASNLSTDQYRTVVKVGSSIWGADPFTSGDLVEHDATSLAELNRYALDPDSIGLLCTDGTSVFDFADTAGTVSLIQFNGSTWDEVVADIGDIDAYLLASGNQSNPYLSGGYVYLSRSDGGSNWLLMRARYRLTTYTPATVDLADIVTAELSLVPGLELSDYDVSDLVGVEVTGFKAVGPPANSIGDLADIYYFDLVPGAPMVFRRRSSTPNGSITVEETGAGVDQAGEPFAGIRVQNDDEIPPVVGLTFPNVNRAHEPDYTSGDRTVSEGPNVRKVQTNVVLTRAQARARAVAATLLARARGYTAQFPLSDDYAAAEPGDVYTVEDVLGNTQNLRLMRLTYADGVKQCEWELNDLNGIEDADLGVTETEEVITVLPIGATTLTLIDGPILRDEDDSVGLYAVVTAPGAFNGAQVLRSVDDLTFTLAAAASNRGVVGLTSGALGDFTGWTWDFVNTVTVVLDEGSDGTLSSSTIEEMEGDSTINAAFLGAHGRWEVIRYRTATLTATRTYQLSGLLRGQLGTEWANGLHEAGDTFVLIRSAGLMRIAGNVSDIGVERYYKSVPNGRSAASVVSIPFTTQAEGMKPYAPVDLRQTGGAFQWNRRSRYQYPSNYTAQPPLGEASEAYDVELYDNTDALVASDTVTQPQWTVGTSLIPFRTYSAYMAFINSGTVNLRGINGPNGFFGPQYLIARTIAADAPVWTTTQLFNGNVSDVLFIGGVAYVSGYDFIGGVPANTRIARINLSNGNVTHTYSPASPDQITALIWDGSSLWSYGISSGNVRQHNPTTLAELSVYPAWILSSGMAYTSGVFALSRETFIFGFDPNSSPDILWSTNLSTGIDQVEAAGDLFFVAATGSVIVLDPADGSTVATHSAGYGTSLFVTAAGDIAYEPEPGMLRFLSGTTGAVTQDISSAGIPGTFSGVAGVRPAFITQPSAENPNGTTALYDIVASSAGYTLRVYQLSETVGRGYVAELTL